MTNDKYINYDIDDPRSGAIAEVMANKTCKKILGLIAERELTASEIAGELGLPLNTTGYNIEKLLRAELIEETKGFFWSVKGKKMPKYKVSNKKIVISPRKLVSPMVLIAGLVVLLLIGLGLMLNQAQNSQISNDNNLPLDTAKDSVLKQFSSNEEMQKFLKEHQSQNEYAYALGGGRETAVAAASSDSSDGAAKGGASAGDYSTTNVQISGVDEPDIVKNDGKYIYTVVGSKVVIVEAYPASGMKIVAELEFNKTVRSIFIDKNKLVVLMDNYYAYPMYAEKMAADGIASSSICAPGGCGGGSNAGTNLFIYDISNKENIKLTGNISASGSLGEARMMDGYIYFVTTEYAGMDQVPMYSVNGQETRIALTDIYYDEIYSGGYMFNNIYSINVADGEIEIKTYLTGSGGTSFVSENAFYLTGMKSISYQEYYERAIIEVIIPILPKELQLEVDYIVNSSISDYTKWNYATNIVYKYSISLKGSEKDNFDSIYKQRMDEFDMKMQKEFEKTIIHKIKLEEGKIEYSGNGAVSGYVLNQFSMDEFEGKLRIATTTNGIRGKTGNHVYILDEDMKLTGKLEDIAPGERIYSARFIDDRVYLVTFRQVDPFYVIDLGNPSDPKILGYLKIPGFSNYLHPYDENHIIGIGMDANEQGRTGGFKVALFDVTDVENPALEASYSLSGENSWSNSEAQYDHKAFLFSKQKNLLVIPVSVTSNSIGANGNYIYDQWQGAYVFNITSDKIGLKGKISHTNMSRKDSYYYGEHIQRSLYMDDTLYTVSLSQIRANSLDDLDEKGRVELPDTEYYGEVVY